MGERSEGEPAGSMEQRRIVARDCVYAVHESTCAMKNFWRALRKALVNFANFFYLLLRMPRKVSRLPQPHTGMAQESMHVTRFGTGTTKADKFLATEISRGQQIKLHGDPGSSRPVVDYGGQPPTHRSRSGLITVILYLSAVAAFIAWLLNVTGLW